MEVPGGKKGLRKGQAVLLVTESPPDTAGDSTESVVLQCGDVEDGEEVMRTEPPVVVRREFSMKELQLASLRQPEDTDGACDNGEDEDEDDGVCRPSDFRAWLSNFMNDSGEHLNLPWPAVFVSLILSEAYVLLRYRRYFPKRVSVTCSLRCCVRAMLSFGVFLACGVRRSCQRALRLLAGQDRNGRSVAQLLVGL